MLFALLLIASIADWVPMQWKTADPATVDLLKGGPVNCILVGRQHWSPQLIDAAKRQSVAVLAVITPADPPEDAKRALAMNFDGIVLEGDFEKSPVVGATVPVIELPSRARMRFDGVPVAGTYEGVWPGILAEEEGATKSAPSGAPWINTNSGFLRFVAAAAGSVPVWISNDPPKNTVVTGERYMQAVADAAIVGARWVLNFDDEWMKRFYSRDAVVLKEWAGVTRLLSYFEQHREWRNMRPLSQLAIVQDVDSGALLSGGVLDMIAVKHTPVRTVPTRKLSETAMEGAQMAVNVSPSSLTDSQREALRTFARKGGTMLSGPASWKFPSPKPGEITLSDEDVKTLDEIWREVNNMTGRRNLGARLFNVSSMLSNMIESEDGSKALIHLVNYSGYPVDNVTVHMMGKYKSATLLTPGAQPRKIDIYPLEEGCGVDVDSVGVLATLLLE
jgi:hypothetical protein